MRVRNFPSPLQERTDPSCVTFPTTWGHERPCLSRDPPMPSAPLRRWHVQRRAVDYKTMQDLADRFGFSVRDIQRHRKSCATSAGFAARRKPARTGTRPTGTHGEVDLFTSAKSCPVREGKVAASRAAARPVLPSRNEQPGTGATGAGSKAPDSQNSRTTSRTRTPQAGSCSNSPRRLCQRQGEEGEPAQLRPRDPSAAVGFG